MEVIPFGWRTQAIYLESLGARVRLRQDADGAPFKTDQGNLILDCAFGPVAEPTWLGAQMDEKTGIVAHGLFLGLASDVIVAGRQGIRHLRRKSSQALFQN